MDTKDEQHWPPHGAQTHAWQQQIRGGTREVRMMRSVQTAVPPLIANRDYLPSVTEILATEQALLQVVQADTDAEGHSAALSRFMIRSESVASSKIERINASARDFAKAVAGSKANTSATSMVAASTALHGMIGAVGKAGVFTLDVLLEAHQALMADDSEEAAYAGRIRDMQNWIGGSDYSPRGALYVPPSPELVPALLDDLVTYLNRDDVPALIQASIGHAQFESIHAFTDGNGRLGRALVSAVLRRRGVTKNAVVPLASGLLARRNDYFAALGSYRRGDPQPIILLFAKSASIAAAASRKTVTRLTALPSQWREELKPRRGSAADILIDAFYDHPIMSAHEVETIAKTASASATYRAIDKLTEAGLIEEVTGRARDRVWAASEIMAELDDLDQRIQSAMNADTEV